MNINQLDAKTANTIEILSSALVENMAWEEVGQRACEAIPEGFIIYLT